MITTSVTGLLLGILLIALIVLVVFLIVLVSNATDTIKKTNAIIDGGTDAAKGAKERIDSVNAQIRQKTAQVTGVAAQGAELGVQIVDKIVSLVK